MKWDGVRASAHCTPTGISLWSRNLREITGSYPEITNGRNMLLDGELVAPTTTVEPEAHRVVEMLVQGAGLVAVWTPGRGRITPAVVRSLPVHNGGLRPRIPAESTAGNRVTLFRLCDRHHALLVRRPGSLRRRCRSVVSTERFSMKRQDLRRMRPQAGRIVAVLVL
ncbi:ATP-dependent DNA ligase, partial [Nocardia salmonicida]|uniref:ATP-dependent DNA ligase n=1 Tax=Nocardia salmonicida TaxID=53431 RepID=UPI00349B5202